MELTLRPCHSIKVDEGTEERVARRYFRQLLEGVAHCHRSGVAHRALPPRVASHWQRSNDPPPAARTRR